MVAKKNIRETKMVEEIFDVHMKKIPQQIWVIDKAEISNS